METQTVPGPSAARSDPPGAGVELRQKLGNYELVEELARGGMGVVFKARQSGLDRLVALKMIRPGRRPSVEQLARFKVEAEASARLDHPNIVPIYEIGAEDGLPYFSMKLVEGGSLAGRMRTFQQDRRRAVQLVAAVARAVHYAHQRGILHRDLKPSNILMDEDGTPYVADFGLAKILNRDSSLTQTEMVMGTADYMSPEQAAGQSRQISTSSDIYSLGIVLYQLLAGRLPFLGETPLDTMRMHVEAEPPRFRALGIFLDRDLETVCLKCVEKEPSHRFESAAVLADDLERWLRGETVAARPVGHAVRAVKWVKRHPAQAVAVALGLVAAGGFGALRWAEENKVRAERGRAEAFLADLARNDMRKLDDQRLRGSEQVSEGVATLASVLRSNPRDRAAAEGLLRALTSWDFPLPSAVLAPSGQTVLSGFSPDGDNVLTGSTNGIVQVWDARSGLAVGPAVRPNGSMRALAFDADGQRFAAATSNGTAQVWELATGAALTDPLPHPAPVLSGGFAPGGGWVVTLCADPVVRLWNLASPRRAPVLLPHEAAVTSARFNHDGTRLVTSGEDGNVWVWSVPEGARVLGPFPHLSPVTAVEFSPDGQDILTACSDGVARVWRPGNRTEPRFKFRHRGRVLVAHYSPDGQRVVTCSTDGTARVWDAANGRPNIPLNHAGPVVSAEFSPDGFRLVTGSADGTARIWNPHTGEAENPPLLHQAGVLDAHFAPDGQRVVTTSADNQVVVWDIRIAPPFFRTLEHADDKQELHAARFSHDGQRVATASSDRTVTLWDTFTGLPLGPALQHPGRVSLVEFSPDGQWVVTACSDGMARLWQVATGRLLEGVFPPMQHTDVVTAAGFSADGTRILTASRDGTARLWEAVASGRPALPPLQHRGQVNAARFSSDGRWVATASSDGAASLWEAQTGLLRRRLSHPDVVTGARFSPDNRLLLTVSSDGRARAWEVETGRSVSELAAQKGFFVSAVFSPDGRRIATAGSDSTARLWDPVTGRMMAAPLRHQGPVQSVEFSPDGLRLVTTSLDETMRIWDVETGMPMNQPQGLGTWPVDARFSPDGTWLLAACAGQNLARLFPVMVHPGECEPWFLDFAEAVAGRRRSRFQQEETVPPKERQRLAEMIPHRGASTFYRHWARWYLADRSTRTILPFSQITMPDYLRRLIGHNTEQALWEALSISPTNVLALCAVSRLYSGGGSETNFALSESHSAQAVKLAPNNPAAWETRAQVLHDAGRGDRALEAIRKALTLPPSGNRPEAWLLKARICARLSLRQEGMEACDEALRSLPAGHDELLAAAIREQRAQLARP